MIEIFNDYNGLKKTKKTKYNIKKINKADDKTNYIYNCVIIMGIVCLYIMLK